MDRVLSDLQPGLGTTAIVGELTLTKTGTTARTATFPDAAIIVAGLNLAQTWTADQTFDTLKTQHCDAATSAGVHIGNATHQDVAIFGAGGGQGSTFYGQINGTAISLSAGISCTTVTAAGLLKHEGTQTASINGDLYGMRIAPTFVEAASGTHPIFAGSYFATPQITAGGATVTDSVTCFIQGAPTNGTTNLSLYVFSGESRLRDRVIVGDLTASSGTVLRVRGPSDSNWGIHLDPAPGLSTPYGMLIEENTGASAGYPLLLVSNNGSSTGYLRVDTGGNVTIGTPLATQGITAASDVTLSGNETYINLSSTYSIGLNVRARMRCVGSGGGSGYGGSLVFDTRASGNAWNTGVLTLSDTGAATFAAGISCTTVTASGRVTEAGAFAEIHVHDASTAQTIATGATYTKSTAFTDNGQSANCTADATNDKITITQTGRYRVEGSFSFTSGTDNIVLKGGAFLGGVEQDNVHFQRKIGTGTDIGNAGFTGIIDVTSVPVDLDVRLAHSDAGSVDITMAYANLNVSYLGET